MRTSVVLMGVLVAACQLDVCRGYGWTIDDLALFDLVEEVNHNFYDLFQVEQDAKLGAIKKAYRRLSLQWHPDRNSDPGASDKFRQIAAVYEVLKTEEGRQKYDEVLENGLPDWRQPIYYYRHVRKMPWWETLVLLLLIATVGHYLMMWGAYFERRLALSEALGTRLKKKEKQLKRKHNVDVDELIEEQLQQHLAAHRPSASRLLPCLIFSSLSSAIMATPNTLRSLYLTWQEWRQPVVEEVEIAEEEPRWRLNPTPRVEFEYSVATDLKPVGTVDEAAVQRLEQQDEKQLGGKSVLVLRSPAQEWTFDELSLLVKLSTHKFPVGTVNRWEKMARVLNRRPEAVTTMMGKLKHMDPKEYQKLCDGPAPNENLVIKPCSPAALAQDAVNRPTMAEEVEEDVVEDQEDTEVMDDGVWGQAQQKLFEQALQQFPKGVAERWEKISRCVPGKTKEECVSRYKQLAELVRHRKNRNTNHNH